MLASSFDSESDPRPFLKWAGGKNRLISQYQPYFPPNFLTYYEPFLGGGAVFFHLRPARAILADVNPELINTYRCVRDQVEPLIILLQIHQQRHSEAYYYEMRSSIFDQKLERAARFIYLNKTCFNGLYRENSKGEFNVPMGRYENPQICHSSLLRSVSTSLQNIKLKVKNFVHILEWAKNQDDFVYFDPPYYPLNSTSNFTAYSRHSFNQNDQITLKNTFSELAKRGVKVMLSNSDCSFIRDLYKDFTIHPISASRAINSKATKRGKISEVLITSY